MQRAHLSTHNWDPGNDDGYEWWLAGFRWRERRPLREGEIAGLKRDRESLAWEARNWRVLGFVLAGFGILLVLATQTASSGLVFVFTLITLIGLAVLGYQALVFPRRIREVDAQLTDSRADVFELVVPSDNPFTPETGELFFSAFDGNYLAPKADRELRSHRPQRIPVTPSTPQSRALTDQEKLSLLPWGHRAELLAGSVALLVMATVGLVAYRLSHFNTESPGLSLLTALIFCLNFGLLSIGIPARLKLSRTLRRATTIETAVRDGVPYEKLAGSDIPWSIDGFPAAWRRQRPSAFDNRNPITESWKKV